MKPQHKLHYRTVWISDTHLGSKGCRAEELSKFLKHIRCDTLYLVGDILDLWRLRQKWYWPAHHNAVIRRILKHAKRDTRVIYIPGNHDDAARQYHNLDFGGVKILRHDEHTTADGKRLFICHGDQYDLVVKHSPLLSKFGSFAYEWLLVFNRLYNQGRALLGMPYLSMSQAIKGKVKRACTFISRFEEHLISEARKRGYDGVVCGHIHKAEQRTIKDDNPNKKTSRELTYLNCGDWVESCTALVEHTNGRIEIVDGIGLINDLNLDESYKMADHHDPEFLEHYDDDDDHDDDMLMDPRELLPPGVAHAPSHSRARFTSILNNSPRTTGSRSN